METQIIVGEAETGRATDVRRQINKLIKAQSISMFDLAELLYEAKTKQYYVPWGFETYDSYAKSCGLKYTKAFYLPKIVERMNAVGISRDDYEKVGTSKLRIISTLEPESAYNGVPMADLIRELTLKAKDMTDDAVKKEVDILLGKTGDESMCWLNLHVRRIARENVCVPALAKAKRFMGQKKDDEGNYHDASDGEASEMIFANFLSDPNFETPNEISPEELAEAAPEIEVETGG